MKIVFAAGGDKAEAQALLDALEAAMPEATFVDVDTARAEPEAVRAAVVANPPPGSLQGLPRLRLIQSLWAGVDRLLADPTLPAGVPLARLVDPAMSTAMAETALWAVIALQRAFFVYARQQREAQWRQRPARRADEVAVLVLGQGEMGRAVAERLARHGCRVRGWRRSGGTALAPLLAEADIVINVLPLTAQTRGLIDARFLAAMKPAAALLNFGRGAHVVDADLVAALDSGHVGHAVLDVFHTEPLPSAHFWWQHPRVTVLPHDAAPTDPRSAVTIAVANLRALAAGRPLHNLVDRSRGY